MKALALCTASALILSCTTSGDSIVVVTVTPDDSHPPPMIAALVYRVANAMDTDSRTLVPDGGADIDLPTMFALLVPHQRTGDLTVQVQGLDHAGAPVASGSSGVTIDRGKRVDAIVLLAATGVSDADGGSSPSDTAEPVDACCADAAMPDTAADRPADDIAPHDSALGTLETSPVADAGPEIDNGPRRLELGDSCGSGVQCLSGHCTDGVCCESACDDACRVCNSAAAPGRCTPVPADEDPRDRCQADGTPCGQDGFCDGAGQCRRPAPGTPCSPPRCTAGVLTPGGSCDQVGACALPVGEPCANGCTADGKGCASPPAKLTNGQSCASGEDCVSGACADGVCCDSACTSGCHACNLVNSRGTCTPVPAGQDPRDDCTEDAQSPCGRDGFCDGAGGCRLRPAGTVCGTSSCSGATKQSARVCDGAGTCRPSTMSSCLPATCNGAGTDCDTTCANNPAGCPAGQVCSSLCGLPSLCCRP